MTHDDRLRAAAEEITAQWMKDQPSVPFASAMYELRESLFDYVKGVLARHFPPPLLRITMAPDLQHNTCSWCDGYIYKHAPDCPRPNECNPPAPGDGRKEED